MLRIVIDFLLLSILIAIIFVLIDHFAGVQVSASGMIGTFIASMLAGTFHSQRAGADHSAAFAWKAAVAIFLASLALAAAAFATLPGMMDILRSMISDPETRGFFFAAMAVGLIVSFLLIRLGFGLGVRNGMKALERKNRS